MPQLSTLMGRRFGLATGAADDVTDDDVTPPGAAIKIVRVRPKGALVVPTILLLLARIMLLLLGRLMWGPQYCCGTRAPADIHRMLVPTVFAVGGVPAVVITAALAGVAVVITAALAGVDVVA